MWKIIIRTAGTILSIILLINVGIYYYKMFVPSTLACNDSSIVSKVTNMLNSSEIMSELEFKVTALNDVQESLYDKDRKTSLCTANATLSNGKSSPIEFRIVDQGKKYDLKVQFTGIAQLILEQLTENLAELGEDDEEEEDEEDDEASEVDDEEDNDE